MSDSANRNLFPLPARWIWLTLIIVLVGGACLQAQNAPMPTPPAAPAAAPVDEAASTTGGMPTLSELFMTSPKINTIIACLSVLTVVMFIYFMLTISIRTLAPSQLIIEVTRLADAKQYGAAAQLCSKNREIFVASILQRCFENAQRDASHLMSIIESEGQRRAGLVWNRISYLIDLSVIAPMLGLLGTVLGMLQAFFILPHASASLNSRLLATAIGGAMTATFFGLIVAIMAVAFHAIVRSRAMRALSEAEQIVHSIADSIKKGQA